MTDKEQEFQLIVISDPDVAADEAAIVNELCAAGLELLHIRKPRFSSDQLEAYIAAIDQRYHNRIVLHQEHQLAERFTLKGVHVPEWMRRHFKPREFAEWRREVRLAGLEMSTSVHTLADLSYRRNAVRRRYSRVFLSPVFDSISKPGYAAAFEFSQLHSAIAATPERIVALGGVRRDRIAQIKEAGFSGCALMGVLWTDKDPLQRFIEIKEASEARGTGET